MPAIHPIPPTVPRHAIKPEHFDFEPTRHIIQTEALGGGGGAIQHPFQLQDASTIAEPLYYNVRYGTVNDEAPTLVATDIALADDATNYIYLELTVGEDGLMTAVTVADNTTGKPADEDYAAYVLLGNIVTASGLVTTINQACTHSLRFAACGRTEADPVADPAVELVRGTYEFWGF